MSSGDGNAVDEVAEAMTFSDDFMRAYSGEAFGINGGNASGMPGGRRQGPPSDIIENAFPTLMSQLVR